MNIHLIPMLISGILCALISIITWLLRGRDNLNRVFSLFTLALALDSFSYFMWFQYGRLENIDIWMRIIFPIGILVPIGLILFFFAFTGYDKRMDDRVLGIKVKHFQRFYLLVFVVAMVLAMFTDLMIIIPENPKDIWDTDMGLYGMVLVPLFAGIFFYMLVMVFKSYRGTDDKPRRRFILLLALGTVVWVSMGYIGILFFPTSSGIEQAFNYAGTAAMAVFFFVAIVNYQSDKVHELNVSLELKVEERTRELQQKNSELENTLRRLEQMQKQVIVQEKMATLGQLVAGLTHEINTPISVIRSMNDTKSKAAKKLQGALDRIAPDIAAQDREVQKVLEVISTADQAISQGTERLNEIIINLKNFARLDEAEVIVADIHKGLDSVLALIKHDHLANIEVIREYSDIPPFVCSARKLNQVFFNLLKNACQAIDGKGRIKITTSLKEKRVHVAIRDTGKGIKPEDLESIFDPGFTTRGSVIRATLGLSTCYQIIKEHHGQISVESKLGEGSVFTVVLPLEPTDEADLATP